MLVGGGLISDPEATTRREVLSVLNSMADILVF